MTRTYRHLLTLPTFEKRFQFFKLDGKVGQEAFGFDQYFNQKLYRSPEWKQIRLNDPPEIVYRSTYYWDK